MHDKVFGARIPEDLQNAIRQHAVKHEMSLRDLMIKVFTQYLMTEDGALDTRPTPDLNTLPKNLTLRLPADQLIVIMENSHSDLLEAG